MPDPRLGDGQVLELASPAYDFVMESRSKELVVLPVRGPAGPQGPAGGSTFSHRQDAPAAQWTVTHNLGVKAEPLVLLDSAPTAPVWTDVEIVDDNQIIITFPSPVTGWVHIN